MDTEMTIEQARPDVGASGEVDRYIPIHLDTVQRLVRIVREYKADHDPWTWEHAIANQVVSELQVALTDGNWWAGDRPRRRAAGGD